MRSPQLGAHAFDAIGLVRSTECWATSQVKIQPVALARRLTAIWILTYAMWATPVHWPLNHQPCCVRARMNFKINNTKITKKCRLALTEYNHMDCNAMHVKHTEWYDVWGTLATCRDMLLWLTPVSHFIIWTSRNSARQFGFAFLVTFYWVFVDFVDFHRPSLLTDAGADDVHRSER